MATIEFSCPCGKRLAVGEELAGKRARCPACGAVNSVPPPGPRPFPGNLAPPIAPGETVGSLPSTVPPSLVAAPPGPPHVFPYPVEAPAGTARVSGLAVAGFALSFLGCSCLTMPVSVGLCIAGIVSISRSGGAVTGTGLSIAGLAINAISWILAILFAVLSGGNVHISSSPQAVPAQVVTKEPVPAQRSPCRENLLQLQNVLDEYLREKGAYPPGTGAEFLVELERYGRERFPSRPFTIDAPEDRASAYRGPAQAVHKDLPANFPIVCDAEDAHYDRDLHVLYRNGVAATLRPGTPEYRTALAETR